MTQAERHRIRGRVATSIMLNCQLDDSLKGGRLDILYLKIFVDRFQLCFTASAHASCYTFCILHSDGTGGLNTLECKFFVPKRALIVVPLCKTDAKLGSVLCYDLHLGTFFFRTDCSPFWSAPY